MRFKPISPPRPSLSFDVLPRLRHAIEYYRQMRDSYRANLRLQTILAVATRAANPDPLSPTAIRAFIEMTEEQVIAQAASEAHKAPHVGSPIWVYVDWPFEWELDRDPEGKPIFGQNFWAAFYAWRDGAEDKLGDRFSPILALFLKLEEDIIQAIEDDEAGAGRGEVAPRCVIASQADVSEALGKSRNTAGFLQGLKEKGFIEQLDRLKKNLWKIRFSAEGKEYEDRVRDYLEKERPKRGA